MRVSMTTSTKGDTVFYDDPDGTHVVLPFDPALIDDAAVEAMARAMFNADMPLHEHWWLRMTEDERDMYREGSRAALSALLAHLAEVDRE